MSAWADRRLRARLDAAGWPNAEASRRVDAGGIGFHVQEFGDAQEFRDAQAFRDRSASVTLLMLHGTGASTHSFAPLLAALRPALAAAGIGVSVIMADLPGHGFTEAPAGFQPDLPGMAAAVSALVDALAPGPGPLVGVGHSAGGAILLEIARARPALFARVVTLNAALEPMRGHAFLSPLAKGLFLNPFTPHMFAWRARYGGMTRIMLRATGSSLDEAAMARYQHLLEDAAHVRGALAMMANWDLQPLQDALPGLRVPVTLIAAEDDAFVPARVSREAAARLPSARLRLVALGGHLVHETDPDLIADMLAEDLPGAAAERAAGPQGARPMEGTART